MKTNKMRWSKPELLVLTKSQPEESVLNGCKMNASPGGPGNPNKCPVGNACDLQVTS